MWCFIILFQRYFPFSRKLCKCLLTFLKLIKLWLSMLLMIISPTKGHLMQKSSNNEKLFGFAILLLGRVVRSLTHLLLFVFFIKHPASLVYLKSCAIFEIKNLTVVQSFCFGNYNSSKKTKLVITCTQTLSDKSDGF